MMLAVITLALFVVGVIVWAPRPKSIKRRWHFNLSCTLLLFVLAFSASQLPAQAGFLSNTEAFTKTVFPRLNTLVGFIFDSFRMTLMLGVAAATWQIVNVYFSSDRDRKT